jgi:hypothetical protein
MAEVVGGEDMIEMRKEVAGGEGTGADEGTEIEVSILCRCRKA